MNESMSGLRILNTRPKHQAQLLTQDINNVGGLVIECPALEIVPTHNGWLNLLPNLSSVQQAIFISANAVHFCFQQLHLNQINWPSHINVIAIGAASAAALRQYKITLNELPEFPDSEHLLSLNSLQHLSNQIVLLFKGEGGRQLIDEMLSKRGATVVPLIVYKRMMPEIHQEFVQSIWRDDLVDIILFTSEQSMHNIFFMFGNDAHNWLINKPCIVISERLAQSAASLGIKNIVITHPEHIIKKLLDFSKGLINGEQ